MIKIRILGMGCSNCKQLHDSTLKIIDKLKIKCDVEYVTDIQKIASFGIMQTPALMINNKIVIAGLIPDLKELEKIITQNLNN